MKIDLKALLVFLLIVSQICGLYGGFLQVPRFFALLFLPILIKELKYSKFVIDSKILYFSFFYLLFGVISVFRMINSLEAVKEVAYGVINFVIFIEVLCFTIASKVNNIKLIAASISILVILTIPIGMYEIFTDKHFSNSKFGEDNIVGGLGIIKQYAAITFGNYNLYNHLLAIFSPFLLVAFSFSNLRVKFILIISLLGVLFILLTNGSRGALISFLISIFLFFLFFLNVRKSAKVAFGLFFLILCGIGFLYVSTNSQFIYIVNRLSEKGFNDSARNELIKIGVDMFLDTNYMGIGAGNFEEVAKNKYNSEILAPHNVFIELLSQYGIIVFILFLNILFNIFRKIKGSVGVVRYVLITSLLIFPIAFTINSVYLSNPYLWVYLACLYIFCKDKFISFNYND